MVWLVPYHVIVSSRHATIYGIDLTEELLKSRFLEPYEQGSGITWDGTTIAPHEMTGVKVWGTKTPVGEVGSQGWTLAVERGADVTNTLILGPPGWKAERSDPEPGVVRNPRRVMIVHGRNTDALNAMVAFVRSLGLEPILWEDAIEETGMGSPHNLDAVMAAMQVAQAVVVIFTAEDEARLMKAFRTPEDADDDLEGQPRPNVFLEAGMAMALGRERTILTRLGDFRGASDVEGLNAVRLDNSSQRRAGLRRRLENAGCAVNDRDHYLNHRQAGDFDAAITR